MGAHLTQLSQDRDLRGKEREEKIKCEARELVKESIRYIVENYNYAVKINYMMETINL